MSSINNIGILACVITCILLSIVSAKSVKAHHGWSYEPYQLQDQQRYESSQYQANSDSIAYKLPQTTATPARKLREEPRTKHTVGDHYTNSGHDDEDNYDDHHSHPKYQYSYHVEEHKTGDYKRHEEERDGDVVKGEYSFIEADGTLRTVKYTVDKDSGFQAVVIKEDGKKHSE